LSLVNHFEGEAQRDRVKDNAYATIAAAHYYGERKKFTFETYITIHQDAYSDLEQYGEIISEENRVRDLLYNIKDTSPAANAAKGTILATPNLRSNFSSAVAHLTTALQLGQSLQQETRNISSTNSAKGKGGHGQNQGQGRGGGRNRGGRGGHGRGGRNIYLGSYSPDQWRKLTAEDKKRVIEGRENSANSSTNRSQHQGGHPGQSTRQVSSVTYGNGADDGTSTVGPSGASAMIDQAILQGALQGTAAVGKKRGNTESAGSQMSRRRINALLSSKRTYIPINRNVSRVTYKQYKERNGVVSGLYELGSHADTCVAGANCTILEETDQLVDVSAFSESLETMKNAPIVTAATAFDDPRTGTTYILILGQAIYMGEQMQNTLICPNQLRANGIIVDECPKHLSPPDNPSSHSMYSNEHDFKIPLSLKGVTSCFQTRTPTNFEVETCKWIVLSDENQWDPHSDAFQENEENFSALQETAMPNRAIFSIKTSNNFKLNLDTDMAEISKALDDKYLISIAAINTTDRRCNIDAEKIASSWNIGLEAAKKTI
jgi:hypothetical protein